MSATCAFTYDDLYDPDTVHEAHQIGLAVSDVVDAVPRHEIPILIALGALFYSICEQADIDVDMAFAQITEGAHAGQFEPATDSFIHDGSTAVN